MTSVQSASTMEERGFELKSMETRGISQYPNMPFRFSFDASSRALLISSFTRPWLSVITTKSTMETFGVGTRTDSPLSFPFSSGRTRATALAAPVVVGIMDKPAALALLKSLCGKSSMR